MTHFLIGIGYGEQHAAAPRGGLRHDGDGKVAVEGVGDERPREAAHVGVRPEAVGGVTLEARDEGDGRREGDADQLRQVQGPLRAALCGKQRWRREKPRQLRS